jgi:hypothetical protein
VHEVQRNRVAKRMIRWLAITPEKTLFNRTEAFQQLKDRRDVTSTEALEMYSGC